MEQLVARRKLLKGKLTRLKNKVEDPTAQAWDFDTATLYEENVEKLCDEFHELYNDILTTCPEEEEERHQLQYNECSDRCDEVKLAIRRILRGLLGNRQPVLNERQTQAEVVRNEVTTKLPKLDIPRFSGNLLEWTTFYDLFSSNVHNHPTLDGAQKLQYLKSLLTGPASDLLQSYQISNANYVEAWDALQKRYKNTRELVKMQLARFMDMPSMKNESGSELTKLVDVASSVSRALKALNRPITDECDLAMYIITTRIDPETHKLWESKIGRDNLPKLSELLDFLDDRAAILNSSEFGRNSHNSQLKTSVHSEPGRKIAQVHQSSTTKHCAVCNEDGHWIYGCEQFGQMNMEYRRAKAKELALCYNCLRQGHTALNCSSETRCKKCKKAHHTLLHFEQNIAKTETVSAHTVGHTGEGNRALLATAVVTITDDFGQRHNYRALIDPGADVSFVSERCIQLLGLRKLKTDVDLCGLGATSFGTARGIVHLRLGSRYDEKIQFQVSAYVLPKLTGILPKLPCLEEEIAHIQHLPLADPYFYQPGAVDLLLGSDIFFNTLKSGIINVGSNHPVALETVFGWIVGGTCPSQNFASVASVNLVQSKSNLDEVLERFWKLEEIPNKSILTKDEKVCEEHFLSTTTRDANGRFIVELPFKENAEKLGSSRDIAVKRLMQMERKLSHDSAKMQKYIDVIRETLEMGHLELVPEEDLYKSDAEHCYLSHHAVIKESSTTTQLRVVYDASAKTSSGHSLNDILITGQKLQDDLFVILVRFRMHPIVFTADISKMFRQIWIAACHRDFQRIVWRESPDHPIKDYRLTTVTFGTSSAPFLAKRCLQKLAEDGSATYPLASEITLRDYYMDDLMSGHYDLNKAAATQDEMILLLDSACMPLRKWSSNCKELLERLDPTFLESKLSLNIDEDDAVKTLGLYWMPAQDQFIYKVRLPPAREKLTKRMLSSDCAKVFDPLGIISPVTLVSKLMLQSLWSVKIDWDEVVPEEIAREWSNYRTNLADLSALQIERCIKPHHKSSFELIGFCDASERAMGAVVYLRSKLESGEYCVRLITGKTKLAPLKQISLPRLELNGAVMLTKLINIVSQSIQIQADAIHVFTDSTVVLAWLAKHPKRWDTFVANRVATVQESLPFNCWHHVAGSENPADCASRGITPAELIHHTLWWHGPDWLKNPFHLFRKPEMGELLCQESAILESRREVTVNHVTHDLSLIQKFSSLNKLVRVTAYVQRFILNIRPVTKLKNKSFLSSEELSSALTFWVKKVQENSFPEEIQCCKDKKSVPVNSRIRSLNPFVDDMGLLRVGGRLRHAKIANCRKNPILLPNNQTFTSLLIMQEHLNNLHGGVQLVLASITRRFWIVNGRDTVRRQLKRCVVCTRFRAEAAHQIMSDLPSVRVNPQRAFVKAGVDYTGPFLLRQSKSRGNKNYKGYIALFICMVTKAVHLEVVSSLSSPAFIACLKRFVARRGVPSDLYSDCGRNFVGADKELKALWKSPEFVSIVGEFMSQKKITWHFNPPASPHFGGIWEAGIKSLKHHLNRSMGSNIFTYEDMQTIICQIEACLNSRPLTQLSSDPSDLAALTPGHFLIGEALTAIPEATLTSGPESMMNRWRLMQRVVQHFWKRWSVEYLSNLQQRPKWLSKRPTLQSGDLVLLKDERFPPLKWKMARIVESHPGADGLSRVFTLRTQEGTIKRSITKLCPLPIDPTT